MAAIQERTLGVARLYARAMLTVAKEQDAADSLGEELDALSELASRDSDFGGFLTSPVLEREQRRRSLEAILRGRASDLLVDSLQVINAKRRLPLLAQIVELYHQERREDLGQVEVRVTTAVELTEAQRRTLRERTRISTGKDTQLVERVVPALLGGLVIQIGDQKIDMSVRRDLELLSQRFAERLSTELLRGEEFAIQGDVGGEQAGASHDGRDEEE